jgi:hypothetical protein
MDLKHIQLPSSNDVCRHHQIQENGSQKMTTIQKLEGDSYGNRKVLVQ